MATINFNDAIYAQEALTALVATISPLNIFCHDYSNATAQKGNVVYVPLIGAMSSTTFSYASNGGYPYEQDGGVINTITVNLTENYIAPAKLTDQQVANSSAAKFVEMARLQGAELGKKVFQRVTSLLTTANFGTPIVSTAIASFSRASTVSIRTVMAKRDVPINKLSLLINEDVLNSFLSDATVYQSYSSSMDVIREGRIPRLAGMDVYETNILPTNSISLAGAACHPNGIALAMRYLSPQVPGAYVEAQRLIDPESGVVAGLRRHYNPGQGTHYLNLEVLFGMAVGVSACIGLLARTD